MALLCKGGEEPFKKAPILGTLNCTISPLTYDDHLVEKNIYAAENEIPIVHYSGMQLGGSFPATLKLDLNPPVTIYALIGDSFSIAMGGIALLFALTRMAQNRKRKVE